MKKYEVLGAAVLAAAIAVPAAAEIPRSIDQMEALAVPAQRSSPGLQSRNVESLARLWFVELNGAPETEGGASARLSAERSAFRAALEAEGITLAERNTYSKLFNGFSAPFTRSQIARVRNMPAVKAVWPVMEMKLDETADLATAIVMSGAAAAHSQLGLTGKGVKVAIIDTGIDYDHPDLGGCFGVNCRVKKGWDFVGDAFNADSSSPDFDPVPHPDPNPDDCAGHGTHVSGIVGANGGVVGVAPEATLNGYRVFGCAGSTDSDIMIKAMERVLLDGNDVLNMSIGAPLQWPQYPTAVAAGRLVKKGVIVVTSIGNSGDSTQPSYRGLFGVGAPGVGRGVIGVASIENTSIALTAFDATQNGNTTRFAYGSTSNLPPTTGTFPLARTGTTSTAGDGCVNAPAAGTLTGQVVLIRRGSPPAPAPSCGFYAKAYNAQTAGAAAVILYNNTTGTFNPSLAGSPAVTIPVVTLTQSQGAALDAMIAAGGATITWTDQYATIPNSSGGLVSTFSSLGPANDMTFKPDLAAPGGNILSTYPLEEGGYANISGTSMASPHTAGAVALMLQKVPKQPQHEVLRRLQNTADWAPNSAGSGYPAPVNRQGAGLIDIDDAITTKINVYPGRIELGEFETSSVVKTVPVRIANSGDTDTFTVSYHYAYETYGSNFSPTTQLIGCMDADFDNLGLGTPQVVTVPHGAARVVNVSFVPYAPCFGANMISGLYIEINGALGSVRRVPAMGYLGDMQRDSMPTSGALAPGLFRWTGAAYAQVTATETWTLADENNVPTFFLHFDEPMPEFSIQVKKTGTLAWRKAIVEKWLQRNNSSTGQFGWEWAGSIVGSKFAAADGTYDVRACAVKRLASPTVPIATGYSTAQCIALPQIILDRP